jgi:FkbM family methyltransferase
MHDDELSSRKARLSAAQRSLLEKWIGSGARESSAATLPNAAERRGDTRAEASAHAFTAAPTRAAGRPVYRLPNGLEIAYQSRVEADHFYEDIFEKRCYVRNGITINDGDCVFDVGGNIGMFTLFAGHGRERLSLYTFEPAPPLFEILSFNVERNRVRAKLFNCGISNETKTAELTFYPHSSGMSSFYADKEEEKDVLDSIMRNQLESGVGELGPLIEYRDELLEERFRSETFTCRLRTLSEVIAEENVSRIDLLKVDVQKSEYDVLAGIIEPDWPKIRQIVLEVHDLDNRLDSITSLLRERGFEVTVEQDEMLRGSVLYNAYAVRKSGGEQHEPAGPAGD